MHGQCGDNAKVSLLVWRTRYTDTFCNAVDCRFDMALEVQRWTRARSECLPAGPKIIVTPLVVTAKKTTKRTTTIITDTINMQILQICVNVMPEIFHNAILHI